MASITIYRSADGNPLDHECAGPCDVCAGAVATEVAVEARCDGWTLVGITADVELTPDEREEAWAAAERELEAHEQEHLSGDSYCSWCM